MRREHTEDTMRRPTKLAGGGSGKWMQKAVKRPGALHKALDVPMDKKIPHAKIEKAENSRSPRIRKEAALAETFEKFRPK